MNNIRKKDRVIGKVKVGGKKGKKVEERGTEE